MADGRAYVCVSVGAPELYAEFARRQMQSWFADMMGDLREIVGAVREIATNPEVDEGTRLRAAEMVMDRIYGKPEQAVDLSVGETPEHEHIIDAITVDRSLGEPEGRRGGRGGR